LSYQLVQLRNGTHAVYAAAYDEKMHPGLGPAAEAEAVYIQQLKLRERLRVHSGEFVIWDVGLGAGANAVTALRATAASTCPLRLVSFDNTAGPLEFALQQTGKLEYLKGYETLAVELLRSGHAEFKNGDCSAIWEFHLGDFPALLTRSSRGNEALTEIDRHSEPPHVGCYNLPAPHAIMFDAFSPSKNPAMWTLPLFANLFRQLDPDRPCNLATYSRSTMLRTTLLLAGFCVGRGTATGLKEETTVAANSLSLVDDPLDRRWLERARRSTSAEPLVEPVYRQSLLSAVNIGRLEAHPQFCQSANAAK
jgi:queuine tRNA-ribosyltransferase